MFTNACSTVGPVLLAKTLQIPSLRMAAKAPERSAFRGHTRSPHSKALSATYWATENARARAAVPCEAFSAKPATLPSMSKPPTYCHVYCPSKPPWPDW